jgi:serine/threonine-protein kinase
VRERTKLKDTAIILLTARGSLEDRITGRRVGADSYLTKPFDLRELLATIEGLLRSRMHLVGQYLVQSRLGRGGQSDVWLAEHRATGEHIALKIIRPGGLEDDRARERLEREHEALIRLQHPNIVRIVEKGEQAGGLFLAMEYLDGVTLDELARSAGALPVDAVAAICRGAASALSHVHKSGLLHRDIKCSNVMLLRKGQGLVSRVRLIDFGTTANLQPRRGRTERIVGSLPYLAPEILLNAVAASPATDVFGLGVVMYRLATGVLPFEGATAEELVNAMEKGPVLSIEEASPGIPDNLAAIIERAIARDPAARWPTARDLERALGRFPDAKVELDYPSEGALPGRTVTFRRASGGLRATTAS